MDRRPPPNLNDPTERIAYRQELRRIARGVRYGGVAITLAGVALALLRAKLWPHVPSVAVIVVIALGALLMLTAIALRTAYHAARMRGD
ncbi:MAG: hypothetical protein J0I47_00450 [Sphingomonas sp.]|uniref:hypothetical protein n=1 Tax=Sphingomonas sp. TaxID=28214 RepID=UPI001ACF5663|nr:hypothetical protein [Sphingomonas sp.]MBN8806698.1 hypothetical protein [Sphingomonas sp.]